MNINNIESTDCEACKRLQRGLTWTGRKPPKCPKHSDYNTTHVGRF